MDSFRTVLVNFAEAKETYELGYLGEDNATKIVCVPPEELQSEETLMYNLAFQIYGEVVQTEIMPLISGQYEAYILNYISRVPVVSFQMQAFNTEGTLLGRSATKRGIFKKSVGDVNSSEFYQDGIAEQVAANTAARHTHENKDILNKFDEDAEGKPTYDGNPIGGGSDISDDEMLETMSELELITPAHESNDDFEGFYTDEDNNILLV